MAKICPTCGREHQGSFPDCHACRNRAAAAARRKRLLEAGLCTRCGKAPPRPGRTMCEACAEKRISEYHEARGARKAAGLCPLCGARPPQPGRKVCSRCLAMRAENRRAAREGPCDGDCLNCQYEDCIRDGRPDLNARARQRYQARVMAGLCPRCGAPATDGSVYCPACLEKAHGYAAARKMRMRMKTKKGEQ